jgi:transcriptional regulator with XRE-family HTH domain
MAVKVRQIVKREIEIPDLGRKIKQAREASKRPLTELARDAGISRQYWYQLEEEAIIGGVAYETLQKIEEVLEIDFGVNFEKFEAGCN